ncbi:MAG TPA: 2-phospho-L-lactate guanylyltransferase [Ktedonobacteraceae bacterium]|nr:2-phospho-L-lactate guanylyltransferase [Ktedonobacteraceae bacterium]
MIYRALIPVKTLKQAKSRLADHLTHEQRASLVLDMLHHVISTLKASNLLDSVSVVSPDPRVLEKAELWGARARVEEESGHNPALHAAAQHELAEGATALLTISADLPLLGVHDIEGMIAQSQKYPIVLAPSWEGTGTNALLTRPPLALPYVFGPGSLQHFLTEAKEWQLGSVLYNNRGMALDIDTIDDLDLFHCYETEGKAMYASCYA